MLKTRVLTAVVLLAAFLPAFFFLPQAAWGVFIAAVAGVAYWEWCGFMRLSPKVRVVGASAMVVFCVLWLLLAPSTFGAASGGIQPSGARFLYIAAALFWLVVIPMWLRYKWPLPQGIQGLAVGALVVLPAWAAMVQLRMLGGWPFLAILATIWVADIAAYFFGRTLGRHKLAPTISPGKTWEGAIGGALAVIGYGLIMRMVFQVQESPVVYWIVGLALLSAISIIGDLFESLLKRQIGLKDSSNALPGHGGVLDRIDSVTSTLPLVALMWLFFGQVS